MKTQVRYSVIFLFILGLAAGPSVSASTAWVSVPSASASAENIVISGGGLLPFSTVTLRIEHSSGRGAEQFVTAGAEGDFAAEYLPGTPGRYSVRVFDQEGKELGGGDFLYQQ